MLTGPAGPVRPGQAVAAGLAWGLPPAARSTGPTLAARAARGGGGRGNRVRTRSGW